MAAGEPAAILLSQIFEMKYFFTGFLLLFLNYAFGQNVNVTPSIDPVFFGINDEVTITYDVTGTALANLTDAYIWMWAPDQSIDAPHNVNPANSNTAATDPAKLSKNQSGSNTYFTIKLVPSNFLDVGTIEVQKIGMLLKGNDWSDGQTVDYLVDITDGFALQVETPSFNYGFYSQETAIDIKAITSQSAQITFFVDSEIIESFQGTVLNTTHTIIKDGMVHELIISAVTNNDSVGFRHTYISNTLSEEVPVPSGMIDGINYLSDQSVTLVLTAPSKQHVFVIGDFNDWSLNQNYQMKKSGDQFWVTIDNLEPKKEYIYQYLVDGEIRIADPYAEKISSQFDDPEIIQLNKYPDLKPYPSQYTSEAASYLQTDQTPYEWTETGFQKPNKEDLMIYELLVRDFTEDRSYRAVIERLDYFDSLGINAIELMPIMEFEGNLSWGYNPSFMLATDKFYGTEDELKELIDKAHERGIAVIFDIVLNHAFGRSSLVRLDNDGIYGAPTLTNPWLNRTPKHDFNVGYDFNHDSEYTKAYTERILKYWVEKFHIDGYRFDLSKGLTQKYTLGNVGNWGKYDASRVEILKNIADHVWSADPEAYVILEHFADNDEEEILSDYGMMLWGNLHGTFNNAAKGSSTSLDWLYHQTRGWDDAHVVGYFESHDEERLMWSLNHSLSASSLEYRLKRAQLAAVFLLTVPGPKMIWQFGEFGYDEELNNDRVGVKPTKWEYLQDENRRKLFLLYQSLLNIRTNTDYFHNQYFNWNTGGIFKWVHVDHPEVKISIVGNFGKETETQDPNIISQGTWYNYLTGESVEIIDPHAPITLASGDFLILTSKKIENYISTSPIILGLEEDDIQQSILVYPNPVDRFLNIISPVAIRGYQVLNLNGAEVLTSVDMPNGFERENTLDLGALQSGLYIFNLKTDQGNYTYKIYKQ